MSILWKCELIKCSIIVPFIYNIPDSPFKIYSLKVLPDITRYQHFLNNLLENRTTQSGMEKQSSSNR